jgi:two-component system, sensor histidine kinase and response regulator
MTNTTSHVPPKKILVIDDEDDYREVIAATLETKGYVVIEAANGSDGLAAAKEHHPDLVLCDVKMPKMDGHSLLAALKEDPACTSIPFIFLTGFAAMSDMRQGMQLGADDYLTKPFTSDELISAVEVRLSRTKSLQKYFESQFDDIKTSIVRSLPHEFRTPLNGILGCAEILKEESNLPAEEVKEIGALIYKAGQRLHHILENMILFGELQFWMKDPKAIAAMRRESGTLLREGVRSAAEHQGALHKRPDAIVLEVKDSPIRISSMHFTKIMEEVIDNALKFSDPGTTVHIVSDEDEAKVGVTIRDEGRGMTSEQIGKVTGFQQFERRYHEQQGAGLGLVIAKTLAELYGGSLTVESEEKHGTTVKITLLKETTA